MKKSIKRVAYLLLSLVMISCVFASTSANSYAATNSAAATAVENICNTVGYRPSVDNFNDCYAYASAFCKKMYGSAPGGTSGYTLTRPGNFYLVGQTCGTGVTASTLSALLSQAMPGDVVQMYWDYETGHGQHTAIVYSADSTSFTILQDGASFTTIKKSTYAYSSNAYRWSGSGCGISLYRYNGYNSLFGGDSTTTPTPSYANITPDTYYIKNTNNGEYLVIYNNEDVQDGNVQTWTKADLSGMKMVVSRASTGYKIRPSACSSRVVNVYADTVSSGKNVNIRNDTNNSTQWWHFESVSGGYVIRNVQNPSCVLTLSSNRNVIVSTYTGASTQIWTLESVAPPVQYSYLDLNCYYNGAFYPNMGIVDATADVYINGTLVADDVNDFYTQYPVGTRYELKDIKVPSRFSYSGSASGTVGNSTTEVALNFTDAVTYTISYNANGGSGAPAAQTKIHDVDLTLSSIIPVREGYTFRGWSTSSEAKNPTYSAGSTFSANLNVTMYAIWKSNTASLVVTSSYITRISTGGEIKYFTFTPSTSGNYVIYSTGSDDTIVYLYNSSGTRIANNDDDGDNFNFRLQYNFTAGNTYKFGIKYYNASKTGPITFHFGRIYTISYNANGGTNTPSSQFKDFNKNLTLSSTVPTRPGYTFLGWSSSRTATSATYSAGGTYTSDSNVTLYAVWKPNTYSIIYSANGGKGTMSNSVHTYGTAKALNANVFTRPGYTFLGWSQSRTATTPTFTDRQSVINITEFDGRTPALYAVWKPNTYTIIYSANGGKGTMSNSVHTYGTAKALNANAFTRPGYTFLGWAQSRTATTPTYTDKQSILNMTSADGRTLALYAVWKPVTYTVIYSANGGKGTMSNSVHTYGTAKALNANAFTRPGYTFAGWAQSRTATIPTYTDMQSVINLASVQGKTPALYAVWQPNTYSIIYSANGGKGTMTNSTHTYGTAKALTANAFTRPGYTFIGWSTSRTATSPTYTDMQSILNLTSVNGKTLALYAVWKPNTYSIIYSANGGTGTMSNSTHTYETAKALNANAFTRGGYTFLGWSTSRTATTPTYTNMQSILNLTSVNNKTLALYAVWKKN